MGFKVSPLSGRANKKRPSARWALNAAASESGLLAQAEALDHAAVLVRVRALQVIEQLAALADQLEQPATRVEILDVSLEVLGEPVDALGEKRHLDFRRAGIGARTLILLHDLRLLRNLQCHFARSPQ